MNGDGTTGKGNGLAVHCRGVTRSFGSGEARVMALRGIDLDVRHGELMMLVGPSGCGKTTLISVIAAILDADGGECRVLGEDLGRMHQAAKTAFRRRHIGFVFQSYNLIPALTATENVAVPLLIRGEREKTATAAAVRVLEQVGLGERARATPDELSGGQQQRVAIARALVHSPDLIVCDEPTSALDHRTGHALMQLMRSIVMDAGRSLIIVTHDARIFEFADRIAEMDDGRIVTIGAPDQVHAAVPAAVPAAVWAAVPAPTPEASPSGGNAA
ncbi:Lipoprotein-releasing system ATP-binding protein LolD [uncultured Defluviicoccus sp.]|uniref:Lipoprotein-releasing system ATP-binding protein LolD n=1 Tax=metagenome TaxID=256318 RepID=A0A380TDH9_9ZZZZ|nr:Lipoprotein-releasing system ATP-binding protein LolD [uncultured Defluviicoccus sp.]